MKKLGFVLPLLFLSSTALAQTAPAVSATTQNAVFAPSGDVSAASPATVSDPASDEPATLVGTRGFFKHNGWYVAPTFGGTSLDGRYSSLVGLRGAWLINRQFGVGLAGNVFGWDSTYVDTPVTRTRVDGGYGGLLLQYVFASEKLVHGTIDATIGGGGICYDGATSRNDCHDRVVFYVFEPTANIELNVNSFMRVALGAGYRFAPVDDARSLYKPDLSGFVARTSIQFGQF